MNRAQKLIALCEVEKQPTTMRKNAKDVLDQVGLKHRLGSGYKPELDPYQNHYGSVSYDTVHKQLTAAGYHYGKKGRSYGTDDDWYSYDRSTHGGADRITLYGQDGLIKRATRYAGPHTD